MTAIEQALLNETTPRVQALRDRLMGLRPGTEGTSPTVPVAAPYIGREPFHEAWMAHEGEPFPVRLAHAQAAWRGAVVPRFTPRQLVVGTVPPATVISYPTGVFAWDFAINEKLASEHPQTAPVVEYWKAWRAQRPGPQIPALPNLWDSLWITGICAHSTQDYGLAIEGGLAGLRRQVASARQAHPESAMWYDAVGIALDGASAYILAHADAADRAAETAEPSQADEWRTIAANCRHIASEPPETLLQAVQLFEFLFLLNGHDSPGRMDQYLASPLRRDLEAGRLDRAAAQEIVDCLYLKLAEHVCYGATLGGQTPDGRDATNEMTWLSLSSIRRLRLLSPRTALRWHKGTPPELFAGVIHSLAEGATYPTLVNDEVIVPGMVRRGATVEHARDYTFCGCGQTTPAGRAYGSYEDLILNAAKPLTYALHDGKDERSGAQIGPQTGGPDALRDFDALQDAVWSQCRHLLTWGIDTIAGWRRWGAEHVPDFLRSTVTHSCIERGRDWRAGGADYHEGMVDVVGLSNLADSLTAIRQVVFEERRVSLGEFVAALDGDWAGAEDLRQYCLHRVGKFGNNEPGPDSMLLAWLTRINDWLFEQRTAFGGPWGLDIIGWSGAVILGDRTGATPDGRRAGEPLADSAGPAQGRDRRGVTAVLNSMLKLPADRVHGPMALNLRLAPGVVRMAGGEEKLGALVRSYMLGGGQQLQVTVAGADEMRAAQREPARHRDLIVRVGGFSAYFVDLEKRFQDDMIRRTEHAV